LPFFYSDGHFELEVPRGKTRIWVERGTEYAPAHLVVEAPAEGTVTANVELERWCSLGELGWHPGNPHLHYDQFEDRPMERLRFDAVIEDLRFLAVSIAKRWDRQYALNDLPVGVLSEFCGPNVHVECGVEARNNSRDDVMDEGFGHVLLLGLHEVVEPISRGYLVDETDPDYPPLSYVCDDAHRQGGVVMWCHNGRGREAPVAAILGKLDALNLFDPFWREPEYAIWYALLNCGLRITASTGTDWFICSANRVYAYTGRPFVYDDWMQAFKDGRTFITNGPALLMTVEGRMPGDTIEAEPGTDLQVTVSWQSHYPVHGLDLVWNGNVVARQQFPGGSTGGQITTDVHAASDGWIAARLDSESKDSYFEPLYAHASPVYVETGVASVEQGEAAARFCDAIDRDLEWIDRCGRFQNEQQRQEAVALFGQAQSAYRALIP
jgi:hypothetical protein